MFPMGTPGTPSSPSGGSPNMRFPSAGSGAAVSGMATMPQQGMTMMGMPGMAMASPTGVAGMPSMTGMQPGINANPMQAMMLMQQQMMQQMQAAQLMQRQGQPQPPVTAPSKSTSQPSPPPPAAPLAAPTAMTPSQFDQQAKAYEATLQKAVVEEVKEIQHQFKLDDRIAKDLDTALKKRNDTFDEDVKALWEILEGARNPAGLLRVKLREMEDGTFRGGGQPAKDVEEMARKFNLDSQAVVKLAEVLGRREDRKKDIRQLSKHLELSNKPSSLVMLMLKDLRAGNPIKDPEYPAAVGSYAHKRGLKRRSRSRDREKRKRRDSDSDDSSSPPTDAQILRSTGAGPKPGSGSGDAPRPMTLLERFG